MRQFLFALLEACIASIALIPLFLLLHQTRFRSWTATALYLIFSIYLSGIWAVVGLPNVTYIRLEANINLIPLADLLSDVPGALLNCLMFLPLGLFLPLFWKSFRPLNRTLCFGFFMSLTIELLQMFTFRATDINDLLTNTAGTALGWALGRLALKGFPGKLPERSNGDLAILFCSTFLVMFFIHPFLSGFVWNYIL